MQAKFFQFNDDLRNEIVSYINPMDVHILTSMQSTSSLALYPEELDLVDEAFVFLTGALGNTPTAPGTVLGVNHLNALSAILERWPLSQRFPGMIRYIFYGFEFKFS